MPLPTEPETGRDVTYEVACECDWTGEVEGEDFKTGRWDSLFVWECPGCGQVNEMELDHWDGPYD